MGRVDRSLGAGGADHGEGVHEVTRFHEKPARKTAKKATNFKLTVIAHPICIAITWVPCILLGIWAFLQITLFENVLQAALYAYTMYGAGVTPEALALRKDGNEATTSTR